VKPSLSDSEWLCHLSALHFRSDAPNYLWFWAKKLQLFRKNWKKNPTNHNYFVCIFREIFIPFTSTIYMVK
jgi:hypothetical protein